MLEIRQRRIDLVFAIILGSILVYLVLAIKVAPVREFTRENIVKKYQEDFSINLFNIHK